MIIPHVLQIFVSYFTWLEQILGLFYLWLIFTVPCIYHMYYQLVSHVVVEVFSCFPCTFLILSSRVSFSFLIVNSIYSCRALPIDYSYFYSSLCISCNLDQSWRWWTLFLFLFFLIFIFIYFLFRLRIRAIW